MPDPTICKMIFDEAANCYHFESAGAGVGKLSLEDQIEEDKRYGKMVPRNGKYFTVRAMDWNNNWITNRQIKRGIVLAFHQAEIEITLDVRYAKEDEQPDFKVFLGLQLMIHS